MPTVVARARRPRRGVSDDPVTVETGAPVLEDPGQDMNGAGVVLPFDAFREERDGGIPFMSALGYISDQEWPRFWVYLYRLEPAVKSENEKYLYKWQEAVDEELIKKRFGGGKYLLWLKEDLPRVEGEFRPRPRERKHKLSIAGAPILDQVISAGPGSVAGGQARADESDGAAIAKMLPELMRVLTAAQKTNPEIAPIIEMFQTASKAQLTMVSETFSQQIKTSTGSNIGDKLLEKFLSGDVDRAKRDPLEERLINLALSRLENPKQDADQVGQLSLVKDLFGADNLMDLVRTAAGGGGAGDTWKAELVKIGAGLVAQIPAFLAVFQQNRAFEQRRFELEAMRQRGLTVATETLGAATAAAPAAAAPVAAEPVVISPSPATMAPVDPVMQALLEIVYCYNASLAGSAAASLVRTKYTDFVSTFKPLLENKDQVTAFCRATPPLSTIAGEDDFAEFLNQFIDECLHGGQGDEVSAAGS